MQAVNRLSIGSVLFAGDISNMGASYQNRRMNKETSRFASRGLGMAMVKMQATAIVKPSVRTNTKAFGALVYIFKY